MNEYKYEQFEIKNKSKRFVDGKSIDFPIKPKKYKNVPKIIIIHTFI